MGQLFLGTDPESKKEIRLSLERHALTIAGARMGKGACQIIPTLREWAGSTIVIDPKGEAAENTLEQRRALGQDVAILDPMRLLPAKFDLYRRSFDPLSLVREGGAGFRDLMMISDGLVLTTGREHDPHWNESSLNLIAGCLAYLVESKDEQRPHLGQLTTLMRVLRHPNKRGALVEAMSKMKEFGGLASGIAAQFTSETNEANGVLSNTARHLRFLSDKDIVSVLQPAHDPVARLNLHGLRDGSLTLYVVMDPSSLVLHGRFMRLFVRMALSVMMQTTFQEGSSTNAPCLFVLDEFFSLGKIDEIQKAAGLMPGYNVHLWPILQDWGQLVDLYDTHGAQTFLANADAISVFGVSDQTTLQEVSGWIGEMSVDELEEEALQIARRIESSEAWRTVWNSMASAGGKVVQDQKLQTQTALLQSRIGRPKHLPADIQYHLGKSFSDIVAKRMYVFLRTGSLLDLVPTPYFEREKKSWWGRS